MTIEKGAPRRLQYTERHGQMTAAHSIRDFFDVAVELLTNADDSYHGQYRDGEITHDGGQILLDIEPHRGIALSAVRVRDRASGFHNLEAKLEKVGERTSLPGDRGFMARGLKDCAAVGHVLVETIVNGRIDKAEITPAFDLIPYKSNNRKGEPATTEERNRLGISRGNGTVVEIALEPRVKLPQAETLRRDFPWHFALRDIMNPATGSKVLFRYSGSEPELMQRVEPDSDIVYDREHEVPGYPGRRFRFTLRRAKAPLDDPTDPRFRRTGIAVKGRRAIYSCSFIRSELERDPAAPQYFGRLECEAIDALAEEWDDRRARGERHTSDNPIFILDPNRRAGLAEDHPFVRALVQLPVELIKEQFERERKERASQKREVESKETTERLRRLAREASRFMREKLEDLGAITAGTVDDRAFHKSGMAISPVFAQIPLDGIKTFTVKVDSQKLNLPPGTSVSVILSKVAAESVELLSAATELELDPIDSAMLRGSFSVRGISLSRRVRVGCQVDGLEPIFVELQVVSSELVNPEIPGDFAFHRNSYTVRLGGRRTLALRARFPAEMPPRPGLRFQDSSVAILRSKGAFELVPGTTYYEATFSVEGKKPGGKTCVIAEADGRRAECQLAVVEHEEEGVDLKFKLVAHDLGANYRAVWDRKEPNTLLITTQHESIYRYLGRPEDQYPGQHTEPFRVLLAELISDNICRRIVEECARARPHEFDSDKIYLLHNKLMKEFTPVAHKTQLAAPTISSYSPD